MSTFTNNDYASILFLEGDHVQAAVVLEQDGWTTHESQNIVVYALENGCSLLQAALVTQVMA